MRIGVHLQTLRPGKIGGLEVYLREVLGLLPTIDPDVELVLFGAEYNAGTFEPQPGIEVHSLSPGDFAELDARVLHRHRLDAWFCPLLVLEPHEPGIPSIVTIPDLQHEAFPGFFSSEVLGWRKTHYARSARRADAILTLSRFSRQHIVDTFGIDAGKVHAIHLDAPSSFSRAVAEEDGYLQRVRARYQLPDAFFYYPANNWPHKNHGVLFDALPLAECQLAQPLNLVLTGAEVDGAQPWSQVLHQLGLSARVRYLGYVPREDLPGLYALSRALVFPSLFEGFGIPIVEAMRTGCPVVCAASTSLPEVGGDAALYFDPHRPEELAAGMVAVGNGTRREFVEAGYRQAAGFSWERTARATLDVIRQTVARPARAVVGPAACLPLISVVTPSLQQATYVERTIKSVLDQGYPQLEYWVIDGGSTDGTVEILERYRRRYPGVFHYVSEPDKGQADAVNKGLARVRGDIIGWLNSDDTYEPGGLATVARAFSDHPDCDVVYGRANHITPNDEPLGPYPTADHFNWDTLVHQCFVCQPAVFWRRTVVDQGYWLDDRLQLCLDYDFWIRLGKHFTFRFLDRHLANSRVHQSNKTISRRAGVFEEAFAVVKAHFGWLPLSWALGKAHYQRGESDPFYHPRKVAPLTYLLAIVLLARHNWSGPRYWRRVGCEVWHLAGTLRRSAARRLFPSQFDTIKVPALCPVVELGVEVLRAHPGLAGEIDLWWAGQRVARFDVTGPGSYRRLVSLPADPARRPARVSLRSELFRSGAARALSARPYPMASDDGWLEHRDILRVPRGWRAVDLVFMLPAPSQGGIHLTFRTGTRVIDEWHFDTPGTYRQRLRLPPGAWSSASHTDVEFTSNASLPPQPARGETRLLAMRLLEATDASAVDADGDQSQQ